MNGTDAVARESKRAMVGRMADALHEERLVVALRQATRVDRDNPRNFSGEIAP
jgi:hypothetical protein